jgi:hypothetical protein
MIPIYINNRNYLTSTRALVEFLREIKGACPIIVDNDSTYRPLLEWYEQCSVDVVRVRNLGPRAPWMIHHPLMESCLYYAVTDADLDLSGVPLDVLDVLRSGLECYPDRIKAGLSLEIEDLPDKASTPLIQAWESRYWRQRLDARWWDADIDTTFALYRSGREWTGIRPALRAARPYTARHRPWYRIDSEESRYYEAHADPKWATWSNWNAPIATQPARAQHLELLRQER